MYGDIRDTLDPRVAEHILDHISNNIEQGLSSWEIFHAYRTVGHDDVFMISPGLCMLPSEIYEGEWWNEGGEYHQAIVKLIAEFMWMRAQLQGKDKFVMLMDSEGYTQRDMKIWSDVFYEISMSHLANFGAEKPRSSHFIMIFAGAAHQLNYEYAKKHKEDYELMEGMTIILSNNLEENIATHYQGLHDEKKKEIQKINSKPKIKPWKFLFYNNHPKLNRVYFVGQIIRRNLHDQGLMSLRLDEGQFDSIITYHANPASPGYTTINEEYFPESGKWIFQALLDNRPIVENLKPLGFKNHSDVDVDHKHGNEGNEKLHFASSMQHHVQQCYFAIITETKYFHDRSVIRDGRKIVTTLDTNFLDSITFTEKTFKFLIAKIPFILCGMPNSLKVLRDMGYKTFSPYINEAYDLLEDDESRAIAIADEIERLCNMSDEWWVETQKALIPRMEHNFKMVSSITHRNYRFYL